ncbi:hypothetical protein [Aquimarina longa]|uniref:hypothetical protein n=1 Tax=Aquimarina longa TaxID=1080221 RepID=UPI0007853E49|nr:hypothetical protein [Aquimarina longa]
MSWHTTTLPSETGGNSFDYRLQQYLVLDSHIGFLIGNNSGVEVGNSVGESRSINRSNYQTILFKTEDGGESFKKSTLGKGTLEQIINDTQKNLYVIKETYATDTIPKKYSILKSTDLGESWKQISNFDTHRILNVQFYNNTIGIAGIAGEFGKNQLLKTIDGGKTWQKLPISTKGINLSTMIFIGKNELYTHHTIDDVNQTATVNFTTGETKINPCNLMKGYRLRGFFKDHITGNLYSRVYKYDPKESHQLMLYNHTSQKLNTYDFVSSGKELIIGVTVSQNYIGVLRQDNGKTYYYYSYDKGTNWMKEDLPEYLTAGHPVAMYGRGMVWVRNSIRNLYDFQVRKPDFTRK